MDDDTKLKLVLYVIFGLACVAVIGIWESVLKPIIDFFSNNVSIIS